MQYEEQGCDVIYKCSLDRIVDGDTIDVNIDLGFDVMIRKRCRLLGIDTPESRTSDKEEKVYGLMSKKKLQEWCVNPDYKKLEIRCKRGGTSDKFGRVLAEVWVLEDDGKETNVNRWMCENHYAVPYCGQNKDDVKEAHLANREKLGN